ncbi:hypothetical protein CQA38_05055 [Campylobacter sp. MIT 12-5580]|uniref:hypothetical protein n=1 Tax=Campylobacter sp. MIT 12-5580 TaxID=2040651 RepID=UPI0010F7E330|nr:hypothetical protein [Campylobacter sp. MIT 12-5580]TKX28937.1 hypothetical protein CQA38_05055 [Campylobacter sp. MIT 12-5580]
MKKTLMIICLMWVSCFGLDENWWREIFQTDPSSEKLAIEICLDDEMVLNEGTSFSCYDIAKVINDERKKFLIYERICDEFPFRDNYVCVLAADKNKNTELAKKAYDSSKGGCFKRYEAMKDIIAKGNGRPSYLASYEGYIKWLGRELPIDDGRSCENMVEFTSGKWSWFKQADYHKNKVYKEMACALDESYCKTYNLNAFGARIYKDFNLFKNFDKDVQNLKIQEGVQ